MTRRQEVLVTGVQVWDKIHSMSRQLQYRQQFRVAGYLRQNTRLSRQGLPDTCLNTTNFSFAIVTKLRAHRVIFDRPKLAYLFLIKIHLLTQKMSRKLRAFVCKELDNLGAILPLDPEQGQINFPAFHGFNNLKSNRSSVDVHQYQWVNLLRFVFRDSDFDKPKRVNGAVRKWATIQHHSSKSRSHERPRSDRSPMDVTNSTCISVFLNIAFLPQPGDSQCTTTDPMIASFAGPVCRSTTPVGQLVSISHYFHRDWVLTANHWHEITTKKSL